MGCCEMEGLGGARAAAQLSASEARAASGPRAWKRLPEARPSRLLAATATTQQRDCETDFNRKQVAPAGGTARSPSCASRPPHLPR